ncbi:sigma-70 family RNA polymerase sigma factor [Luedemannella helvata]
MPGARIDDAEITQLALAAGRGDRAAAGALVAATQSDLLRFLTYLVGAGIAEDLAQETYLRAMRALPSFAGLSSARTWLMSIARRTAVDHIRTATRRPRLANLTDWQSAAEAAPGQRQGGFEDGVLLADLIRALPDERREAFVATQLLGMSYEEAAEVCECPIGTIRSRVARARGDLAAALGDAGGGRARRIG